MKTDVLGVSYDNVTMEEAQKDATAGSEGGGEGH